MLIKRITRAIQEMLLFCDQVNSQAQYTFSGCGDHNGFLHYSLPKLFFDNKYLKKFEILITMTSDTFKKIRAWLAVALLTLLMPTILFFSVLIYFYDSYVRSRVCKSIAGDVAVVTGAAGGLGKCIATELAAKGCHVAICDINYDLAVTTAKEIADRYGVKTKAYKVDVTKYDEIVELNEKLTNDIGAATILVNNAGLLLHSDQLNPTVPEIELMVKVNYLSHFLTNRVFLPNMKQAKRGHIVAISSVAGLVTLPLAEPYCSAKTAVRTLMRVLRAELRLNNITGIGVTTVFPSFLKTHSKVEKLARDSGYAAMYPLLKGEEVARRTVLGMLRGEVEIAMPGFFMILYRFITILPSCVQDWLAFCPSFAKSTYLRALAAIKKH